MRTRLRRSVQSFALGVKPGPASRSFRRTSSASSRACPVQESSGRSVSAGSPNLCLFVSIRGCSILARPHIQRVAQAVAEEVQAEERRAERTGGEDEHPPELLHAVRAVFNHRAPRTHRRLHAEAEEAQEGFEQHHRRHGERGVNDDRAEHVGNHVAQDDAALAQAQRVRGLDEFHALQRGDLPAHDARHGEPFHRADGGEEQPQLAAEPHGQQDDEEGERQCIEDVHEPHHERVELAADEPGDGPVEHTDGERHTRRARADHQRDAPAVEQPRELVAPEVVRAEPVLGGRRGRAEREVLRVVGVGQAGNPRRLADEREHGRSHAQQAQRGDDERAGERELVLPQTRPSILPQ